MRSSSVFFGPGVLAFKVPFLGCQWLGHLARNGWIENDFGLNRFGMVTVD
jgi:hypothetical protein